MTQQPTERTFIDESSLSLLINGLHESVVPIVKENALLLINNGFDNEKLKKIANKGATANQSKMRALTLFLQTNQHPGLAKMKAEDLTAILSKNRGESSLALLLNAYPILDKMKISHTNIMKIAKRTEARRTLQKVISTSEILIALIEKGVHTADTVAAALDKRYGFEQLEKLINEREPTTPTSKKRSRDPLKKDEYDAKRHKVAPPATITSALSGISHINPITAAQLSELTEGFAENIAAIIRENASLLIKNGFDNKKIKQLTRSGDTALTSRIQKLIEFLESAQSKKPGLADISTSDLIAISRKGGGQYVLLSLLNAYSTLVEIGITHKDLIAIAKKEGASTTLDMAKENVAILNSLIKEYDFTAEHIARILKRHSASQKLETLISSASCLPQLLECGYTIENVCDLLITYDNTKYKNFQKEIASLNRDASQSLSTTHQSAVAPPPSVFSCSSNFFPSAPTTPVGYMIASPVSVLPIPVDSIASPVEENQGRGALQLT